MEKLTVQASPHISDPDSTPRIMWHVVLALVPAFLGSLYFFGFYAGLVTVTSVAACVLCEYIIQKVRGIPITIGDGSAVITGILLAFVLPPNVSLWIPVIGAVVAIGLGKQLFGGLGCNIWNPALVGRAVLQLSFPTVINSARWPILKAASDGTMQLSHLASNICSQSVDVVTKATALTMAPAEGIQLGYDPASFATWMGNVPGCIGETSFILLAVGGIALIVLRRVKWQVPVFYIGTVALLTWIFPYCSMAVTTQGFFAGFPLYQVAFGGLAIGAFFMATDMVTSPLSTLGQIIFATGCGLLTAVIRLYGAYPEGVCYSILIMNTAVPLIDRYTRTRVFGTGGANKA